MPESNGPEPRIACLHASLSNAAQFEEAARQLGLPAGSLTHDARPDLLELAVSAGRLTDAVASETADLLIHLAQDADAVLLTCSTLGPAVELAAARSTVPIIRADAALAAQAARTPGTVVVLCTIETTLRPTQALFAAAAPDSTVTTRLVPGAWALFQAGDPGGYARAIAKAADAAYEAGADQVVLGQASMAHAAAQVGKGPEPLGVPRTAMAAVLQAIS